MFNLSKFFGNKGDLGNREVKIIVGLGNPGIDYEKTRHNAGFMILDALSGPLGASFETKKNLYGLVLKTKLEGRDLVLLKPTTFMNESGRSVSAALKWFKASSESLLVIHDDVSLPLGRLRFQHGGGAGGQHGVESIQAHLQYESVKGKEPSIDRLKFGVGPDPGGSLRAKYVLSRFPQEQTKLLEKMITLSCEAIDVWLKQGIKEAMSRYNGLDLNAELEEIKNMFPNQD